MYSVYILKSTAKNYHYIGVTQDMEKRLKEHNSGHSKSTKPYKPFEVIYTEKFKSKKGAHKREFHLKSTKGYSEKVAILSRARRGKARTSSLSG
ncbi:MAG: GIY-YIG nuclease family protein [Patescibacteria group bacterium]